MEKFNILVCDDEKSIVDAIEIYLKQENYNIIKAYNGEEALQALEQNEIHLILLDIMMPKMDGLNTTIKIRERLNIPIIILSAKSEDTDKILGLNFGADDYITKPFNLYELLARIEANLKRTKANAQKTEIHLTYRDIKIENCTVSIKGEIVQFTSTELAILALLLQYPQKIFSKQNLYESIWQEAYAYDNDTINTHISNIRKKIKKYTSEEYIETVWGIGYKLK